MSAQPTAAAEDLLFERQGGIALITINRPEAMNALTPEMADGLESLVAQIEDDPELHVTIITGAGTRAFCAGGDLETMLPRVTELGVRAFVTDPSRRFFSDVTKPIIAAVNGVCVAGGMEIMLGTDLRVVSDDAVFGIPEATVGLLPAGGGTVRLPRQLPWARAMEMLLLGSVLRAPDTLALGLVNRVVPKDEVLSTAMGLAERLLRNGPIAMRRIKESALRTHTQSWSDAFYTEFLFAAEVFASEDAKEGPRAFTENAILCFAAVKGAMKASPNFDRTEESPASAYRTAPRAGIGR